MTLETVEKIVALLAEYPVSEITLEQDGERLRVCRPLIPAPPRLADAVAEAAPVPESEAPPAAAEAPPEPLLLTATMVGLFHHAEPPVGYGARLALGQLVGSIESIKVMNDVYADAVGQVVDVLVEEGAPVEYGQPLFRLLPG